MKEVSFRDQIAMSVLPAVYTQYWMDKKQGKVVPKKYEEHCIKEAYRLADEMLKFRENEQE